MSSLDQHLDRPAPSRVAPTAGLQRFGSPRIIGLAVVAAVAANVVIWLAGVVAGGSFEYTDGGEVLSAAPGGVVVLTAVPLAVGLALTALVARWWLPAVRVAQVVGSALALLTIAGTLAADFDGASTVALSLSHVALVPFLVVALEAIRLRILDRRSSQLSRR